MRRLVVLLLLVGCDFTEQQDKPDPDPVDTEPPPCTETLYYPDQDGDGFGLAGSSPTGHCDPPGSGWSEEEGDCKDNDTTTFPGATELCDGLDNDCNDDVPVDEQDTDGDKYVVCTGWTGDPNIQSGDCDPTHGDAYPGGIEVWYDGIDQDCLGGNDYDQDGDGYVHDNYPSMVSVDAPNTGDCADDDATWNPSSLDTLGDNLDGDCDGLEGATRFKFGSFTGSDPRKPRVGGTSSAYVLAATDATDSALWSFDLAPTSLSTPTSSALFAAGTYGWGVDLMVPDPTKPEMWAAAGFYASSRSEDALSVVEASGATAAQMGVTRSRTSNLGRASTYNDVDVALAPDGDLWVFACTSTALHFTRMAPGSAGQFVEEDSAVYTSAGGDTCFLEPPSDTDARGTACTSSGCTSYDLTTSGIAVSSVQWFNSDTFTWGDSVGAWILAAYDTGGVTYRHISSISSYDMLMSRTVYSADLVAHSGDIYLAAVVDDGGSGREVIIATGFPAGSLTETVLPFEDAGRSLVPEEISLHVDSNVVFVAVSGTDSNANGQDDIGWAFLATP